MLSLNKLKYIVALLLLACSQAKADYVIAFHNPPAMCEPCREMIPSEDALIKAKCDIRRVDCADKKNAALVTYYHVGPLPYYVYVVTTPYGDYDSGFHMVGWQDISRLRRFCSSPGIAAVGSATRNVINALITPYPIYVW